MALLGQHKHSGTPRWTPLALGGLFALLAPERTVLAQASRVTFFSNAPADDKAALAFEKEIRAEGVP